MIELRLQRLIRRLGATEVPDNFDVDSLYIWADGGALVALESPIPEAMRVETVSATAEIRLQSLAVVSRMATDTVELLFKVHRDGWTHVLPSVEELDIEGCEIGDLEDSVAEQMKQQFGLGVAPSTSLIGGLVSFKVSPSNSQPNCYVFPLIAVRTTLPQERAEQSFSSGGRNFEYLAKSVLEANKDLTGC